jgi:hypothetical protein
VAFAQQLHIGRDSLKNLQKTMDLGAPGGSENSHRSLEKTFECGVSAWQHLVKNVRLKQFSLVTWTAAICTFLIIGGAVAGEISAIEHTDKHYTGIAEVHYPEGTALNSTLTRGLRIVVKRYQGRWKDGLAEGYGELSGFYIIPSTENLVYQQLKSDNPAIRGQAMAVIERVRGDAIWMKQDPEEAVRQILGEKAIPITYMGEFEKGSATGYGELASDNRKLKGTFYQWLPEGLATHLIGDFPVIAETFSKGVPSDGPVLINQYPAGVSDASRRFVGVKTNGKLSGDWYELQWRIASQDYSTVGMGDTTLVTFKDGTQLKCQYEANKAATGLADELSQIRGDIDLNFLLQSDPMYLKSPRSCSFKNSANWVFNYSLSGNGPFNSKTVPPYSCFDPQGKAGTFSINEKEEVTCNVTTVVTTYKFLSKIGREIERVGRDVKKVILWPIETVGKAGADTLCDVVQKEPGKNCNVSLSYGKTFEIPDNKAAQEQRSKENLSNFLAARKTLFSAEGSNSVKGQWEVAAKSLDKCAADCIGPARDFSMLSIQEIASMMTAGFKDDIARYRLASFTGKNGSIFDIFRPYFPFQAPTMDTDAILSGLANVIDFSTGKVEETPLSKYVGGVGAVMDAANMIKDYNTMFKIQNKIAWTAASLKGNEVAYVSISVTPGGDVSLIRLQSKDQHVLEDPNAKTIRTTIVGVMTTGELMDKLDKEARQKANAELQRKIDEDLQRTLQNSWKK